VLAARMTTNVTLANSRQFEVAGCVAASVKGGGPDRRASRIGVQDWELGRREPDVANAVFQAGEYGTQA
jgi:hypothetical protein